MFFTSTEAKNPEEYANSANEPNMNQNNPEKQILSSQTKDVNLAVPKINRP